MRDKFIVEVERLSGRHVNTFISDSHVGPDLQIELFILGPDRCRQRNVREPLR
jgi:hypothetical protein